MAYTTVASVVAGNKITATWGNSVTTAVGELQTGGPAYFSVLPGGNTDATTSGTFGTWLTSGNITVPTWCTNTIIHVDVTNVFLITSATTTYGLDAQISTGSYAGQDYAAFTPSAITDRHSLSFTRSVTGFSTGTRTVLVGARRASGTGTLRADTSSKITGYVIFLP